MASNPDLTPENLEILKKAVANLVPKILDELAARFISDFDAEIERSERMIRDGK